MKSSKQLSERRGGRVRGKLRKRANGRARLSVFRSGKHIYAQIIDDGRGTTLASASSLDNDLKSKLKGGGSVDSAGEVGKLIATRAKDVGIAEVIFDRGPYLYHGRVKALAEAAREAGLAF